ncbi:hypothetical protein RhiirA5_414692 [Rhizophagus irregularis]|uniref:Crinkler family protein n=1 Tax=Rhizophagus irregularis TaxID=588596 RepID=A0A2N0PTM6_9GLOM|nr:hypothetical protein RhiirA5_414692 [Rhizophagus irregularis]
MLVSFNCSVLSDTFNLIDSFLVNFNKENDENIIAKLGNNHYDFKDFKVGHLKDYICDRRKVADSDRHAVKLWKVDVKDESDIKEKPKEDEMKPRLMFKDYFQDELNGVKFTMSNIHVIAIIPTDPSQQGVTQMSFNCSVLSDTVNPLDSFLVNFNKENNENIIAKLGNNHYDFKDFKVGHLKDYICDRRKVADSDRHAVKLWKVDVKDESDIKEKPKEDEMKPRLMFKDYFQDELNGVKFTMSNIHVIAIIPTDPSQQGVTQNGVNWNDVNSIYNWMMTLKRPPKTVVPKLVSTSGADFPLQGREETMKILMEGNGSRNGICERFTKRNETDRNIHPIPILANGPGTGKSRFLQEIPTLLREQAEKYTNDDELLNMIKDRMYSVNVTFGNGTPAKLDDVFFGETSVALRILYEHFISGGAYDYEKFVMMCGENCKIKISGALEIVLKDVDTDINIIILGIDELNNLHSLYDRDLFKNNPLRSIIHAVGGLNCLGKNIFHVPILAGTIQGPLEEILKESTYRYLQLPLRLLQSREVQNIIEFVSERYSLGDYINSGTFRRCISDFGGQVRALEIFFEDLVKKFGRGTNNVDYVHCITNVKEELMDRYKFKHFAYTVTPAIAHAILNIPVSKHNVADKDGRVSYIDLSSEGILNLEKVADSASFYVRMPYIWIAILTSFNKSCEFWEVMIKQDSHVFWESFEFFNVKFWTLRLTLLSILNKDVTIKDLFRGAYGFNEFEFLENQEYKFKLLDESSIKYQELKHRYPHTSRNEHLSPCTVYKNCKGAPFDIFFFINNCLFAIQVKSSDATTNQPQTLSKKIIQDEYEKTEKAYKELKAKIPELKDWMLFICTNGPKTEDALDLLQSNCLVVYKANFKDFYGYTYSSRAEFSEANDKLDANTASEYELRTVEMMEEETAHEICNKRLYNDEDDLYSKVSMNEQAKKRIKVVKKN